MKEPGKKERVLLVRPPSIMGRAGEHALQHPINLCYLAAAVRNTGFEPAVLDYEVSHFTEKTFAAEIAGFSPDVIGFTAMTPGIDFAAKMAADALAVKPGVFTVVGGAHVSILPRETLSKYPQFKAAVTGEGEKAFAELCEAVRSGSCDSAEIPSVVFQRDGAAGGDLPERAAPLDLDTLPNPARDLLDFEKYTGAPTPGVAPGVFRATQLFTARGCLGKCIFCCSEHVFGRRIRSRSVTHIMGEVDECASRFGFNHFTIDNDTFTHDRAHAIEFCDAISGKGLTWDCDTRVDRVDAELLRAMARSGCVKVAFGVETGSERILKAIKKGITLEQVRSAFDMSRKAGLLTCAFFMIGNHPEETEDDIRKTAALIREISPDLITVAIATPYPGTELNEAMRGAGLLEGEPEWSEFGGSFRGRHLTRTKTIGPERLTELQSRLLRGFYLRPKYILRRLSLIRNGRDALYWFKAGASFIMYILGGRKSD